MNDEHVISAQLAELRRRLGELTDRDVAVIGVTKGFGPEIVGRAVAAGIADLGENYAQELIEKARRPEQVNWHFIGSLQRNKVRKIADLVTVWHTIDRVRLGEEVARRAPGARVMAQVNVSDETTKGGCTPTATPQLVAALRELDLDVVGLMTVGAPGGPDVVRPGFRLLRALADDLGLRECSMGMSGDFEVAVEEGSTFVRIGTRLFGPRPRRSATPTLSDEKLR